jgi:hypothetical protein
MIIELRWIEFEYDISECRYSEEKAYEIIEACGFKVYKPKGHRDRYLVSSYYYQSEVVPREGEMISIKTMLFNVDKEGTVFHEVGKCNLEKVIIEIRLEE